MKRIFAVVIAVIACAPFCVYARGVNTAAGETLFFIENKGQIKDQYAHVRNDIQFAMTGDGISIFIGNDQLHYQFYRQDIPKLDMVHGMIVKNNECIPEDIIHTYRMDVELLGANMGGNVEKEEEQVYYENYYLPGCPANGLRAHTFKKIVYKNVYPAIDWVLCVKNGELEQEFSVHEGGDASLIKMRYSGHTNLQINDDGSITAITPMGIIKEHAPVCCYGDGTTMAVHYRLQGDVLAFDIADQGHAFVIDPGLEWGTYYGPDTNSSPLYSIEANNEAFLFACGETYGSATGSIATTGAYETVYGGNADAYLVKFDSSGNRIWATYYGGEQLDWGYSVACDLFGNVYLAGFTESAEDSTAIASPGSHQTGNGGGVGGGAINAFLAKFNQAGERIWGTYYGGDQQDEAYSAFCDDLGHVYIAGIATSTFNIATPGSFEPVYNNPGAQYTAGFLAQFDTVGVLQWGTYYEGYLGAIIDDIYQFNACTDGENVYVSAWTVCPDSITTPGCWQPTFGGECDVFVGKFNVSGNRLWATYYGGYGQSEVGSVTCDKSGYLYLLGETNSDSGIASPGAWQSQLYGNQNAFLVQFETEYGVPQWGTYYGGNGSETIDYSKIVTDDAGDVFITGYTSSDSAIASFGAWQTTFGGGNCDAFLAEFDAAGAELWSTYYGGNGDDKAYACTYDGANVYVCGRTGSSNNIAALSGLDSTYFDTSYNSGPLYDKGFIGKFSNITTGIKNIHPEDHIVVYPNPAANVVNICNLKANDRLALYDVLGRKINEYTVSRDGVFTIGTKDLPPGIYELMISDRNNNIKTTKQVVRQ